MTNVQKNSFGHWSFSHWTFLYFMFGVNIKPINPLLIVQDSSGILPVIEGYEPVALVKDVIAWAIIIAAILCIVFIFVGGVSFILSGGQEEKIKQAVGTIRYAIIGLVVVILSITFVNLLTFIFKVPFKFVDYREILGKVKSLSSVFQQERVFEEGE